MYKAVSTLLSRKAVNVTSTHTQTDVIEPITPQTNTTTGSVDEELERCRVSLPDKLFYSNRNKKVLLIDSDIATSYVLQPMLAHEDYDLEYHSRMIYTSDNILANVVDVDLLVIDCSYNDAEGIIKQIRSRYPKSVLPVLVSASSRYESVVFECLCKGANDFIYKPLRYKEVIYRISNLVEVARNFKKGTILQDILPKDVIQNLEDGISFMTKFHPCVTILFSDIVSYTVLSSTVATKKVIYLLNTMFCGFDDICINQKVYKVETIGDAYMIASGHDGTVDHVNRMIETALDMLRFMQTQPLLQNVHIRIGIHTGAAHSGVIGKIRPRYCFFGDTINTASRMESHGLQDAIQISQSVYEGIADAGAYHIEPRGEINVKGKGAMQTYLIRLDGDPPMHSGVASLLT